ncbi:bifunctional DNA-formamidopyrimidine glycosylase/DNA-(apurinic or apyrimidinic site) lyase [Chloroflexus sp. MS-CIW-1]|jgi:formamidopyrimidine-DNA glycosylase|uniref:bifunctional DNA-formamidopyrimidine glycosylase/DNA-(apurinic or apyrimidinic site) lyase n=1 Tax=Chloroflexus sp. MS-CIW-1 TaxID=3055768 RepID=UPI001AFDF18A|nr:bifunctional DNA-formamidopyrimidine glycosylase/DNA-(apurinic or apyrimidinic site) lyase [Chloroflexus sp. MS-CIW-1]MBO9349177.1 bifunctional DNA-formamidopyrimidine glycosylase/DNA-(apurinic or apyrimidinic site) lyase [Chloroflexus sp.]MDN5271114.1 bifunctional DNA-formamidopyrimidine glycosylase/DNA-(apurinic or apyrimidinic site) lyase [Chloroflexus sp. MS-CIW-1]
MPELPEVETVARSLVPQLQGRIIVGLAKLDWPKMITPSPSEFAALITGRRIESIGRRAKWLLLTLDRGWTIAIHLRMSGHLLVTEPAAASEQHVHFALALDNGRYLIFNDQRKFGRVHLLDQQGLAALDQAHGPEPLADDFTPDILAQRLQSRRAPIKTLLLDQHLIAGIGNIYANEALWRAGIHPLTPGAALSSEQINHLHRAIRAVLQEAIANQGSSLRNYRDSYGRRGSQQEHFTVYDRAGEPCPCCQTLIERIVIAQRSTYFCPVCQQGMQPAP